MQIFLLTIAAGPAVAITPSALSYGNQIVGTSSVAQAVTLTNTSTAVLTINGITLSGTGNKDFPQTNNCGASVPSGGTCTINVVFKPTAGGSRTATLNLNDNASGSPQTVTLSGTGGDFSIVPASNSSTSVSVSAGQTATYNLVLEPAGGLTGSVGFTCSGAASVGTCTVSPSPAGLSAANPTTVTASVATIAASGVGKNPRLPTGPWIWLWMLGVVGLVTARLQGSPLRNQRGGWTVATAGILVLALLPACGGAGATQPIPNSSQASADTCQFTLTGTYVLGGTVLQHTTTLSLTLK